MTRALRRLVGALLTGLRMGAGHVLDEHDTDLDDRGPSATCPGGAVWEIRKRAQPRPCAEAGTVPGPSRDTLASAMSAINHAAVARRLTPGRLTSYLTATSGDLPAAIELYDWNVEVGGAVHEDIGRLEVVFRNALDEALVAFGYSQGWSTAWYRHAAIFPGKHGQRALENIQSARTAATRRARPESHGKVIAELTFGFWRYLCTTPYLTSPWVPALVGAFPNHPQAGNPRAVRSDVEERIQRVQFLRNRVAHHEPIHERDLRRDQVGTPSDVVVRLVDSGPVVVSGCKP